MSGEKNLSILLKNMRPKLNEGVYVFCSIYNMHSIHLEEILGFFKESEGYTIIVSKEYAERNQLHYSNLMAWITLEVHSALDAVGLTAAFSTLLANHQISCNVLAGYYHDHLFVLKEDANKAMDLLNNI